MTNKNPSQEQLEALWRHVQTFIDDNNIWGGEMVVNNRRFCTETLLIELCGIVGYVDIGDEDDEE